MSVEGSSAGAAGSGLKDERRMSPLARSIRRALLKREIKTVCGPPEVSTGAEDLTVLCLVRDGLPYVREFVDHYRSLGAKHLVFLDNGSSDGTVEALRELVAGGDVTILRTGLPYGEYKYLMKQYLHERFGMRRWSLYADIDEFLDYPYSDVVGIGNLLRYLTENGYTAVACQMLDMFPERLVAGATSTGDEDFVRRHRLYDLSKLGRAKPGALREWGNTVSNASVERFSGGIRETLFGVKPNLTKYPLVYMDGRIVPSFYSSHRVSGASVADISCVLYHYKFLQTFHDQARRAVEEGNYYAGSREYRKYLEVLDSGPELVFRRDTSRTLAGTDDLLEENFLIVSEGYTSLANLLSGEKGNADGGPEKRISRLHAQRELATEILERREKAGRRRAERLAANARAKESRAIEARREGAAGPRLRAAQRVENELSDSVRPLFVGGCQRSGTTAFIEYINEQAEIAVCFERYKQLGKDRITPEKFTFERILDYRAGETRKPWNLEEYIARHRELLERKDPRALRWIGDKNPNFVVNMQVLLKNNPGARFIMLHRYVEEVAESWQARATDGSDHWNPDDDFEKGVRYWNRAMQSIREFAEGDLSGRMLVVGYHDFFGSPEKHAPLLSRFLGVEFSDDVLAGWREKSETFRAGRRTKSRLTGVQEEYIGRHADRSSEAYVLERISKQLEDPSIFSDGDPDGELAVVEARAFAAERRYGRLLEEAERFVDHHGSRARNLEAQIKAIKTSRAWRSALLLGNLKNRVLGVNSR